MKNNISNGYFLLLTLVFAATYMNEYGVDLLKWLLANSPLYAYTLGLSTTSLPGIEAINIVLFTIISLAVGALGAWIMNLCFSCTLRLQERKSEKFSAINIKNKTDVNAHLQENHQ